MKKITIAVLAHVDAGKTTLTESILYNSGIIQKIGRVDNQDAYLDFNSQERSRGITIFSKETTFTWHQTTFHLLDTPGHVDFSCEMERVLQVLDYAVLIVSAKDGVQSHTKTIWELLKHYRIPTFIFINKMDLAYRSKAEIMSNIQQNLDEGCIDYENDEFKENVALTDETLLNKYLLYNDLTSEMIAQQIKKRMIYPCFFGCALKNQGIEEFLDSLSLYTIQNQYHDDFSATVFKITTDDKNNKLTHIKITGGSLHVKDIIANNEKVDQIRQYSGSKYKIVDHAYAGDVVALKGIKSLEIGTMIGKNHQIIQPVLQSFMSYRLILPKDCDHQKAFVDLKQLAKEDPSLHITFLDNLKEIKIKLMGDIQVEVLKKIIKERFNLEVKFDLGQIAYQETIANKVEGVGHYEPLRHYAEVHVLLEPLPRGSGLVFANKCQNDILPQNFQNLILKHFQEKEHLGVLTGSPITDIKITLLSGRAHQKHTEGGDFRQATYRAIRHGLKRAKSILLEPYYQFHIEIKNEYLSKVIYDLEQMKGTFTIHNHCDDTSIIKGSAPVVNMMNYQKDILSYTKGTGYFHCMIKDYQPCLHQDDVIEQIGYDSENDIHNPTGSIFCKHGAGYNVKWNEVDQHMHLPYSYVPRFEKKQKQNSYHVSDKELEEIFIRTYGPTKYRLSKDMKKVAKKENQEKVTILPECLLVDGYNVIFSWQDLNKLAKTNLDAARAKLIDILCNYQGYRKCVLIVVFDAYKVKKNTGTIEKYDNIYIVYTKEAQTADMYIEHVTHDLAKNYRVIVATSDALEQIIVTGRGATRISSRELRLLIDATNQEQLKEFQRKNKQMKNYLLEEIKDLK